MSRWFCRRTRIPRATSKEIWKSPKFGRRNGREGKGRKCGGAKEVVLPSIHRIILVAGVNPASRASSDPTTRLALAEREGDPSTWPSRFLN